MKERNFYQTFIMLFFVVCYVLCFVLSSRTIQFGGLIATAGAIIYPFTYFIAILFYERYGSNKTFELLYFSIASLIFAGLVISLAGTFSVYGGTDGLEKLFNVDYRVLFSSIVAFLVGQYINIRLYDFLGGKRGIDFLLAGVISITIDSFLFIGLAYLGADSIKNVLNMATGQYVLSVIVIIIYALCFNSLIPVLLEVKERSIKEEKVVKSSTKKTVAKKTVKKDTKKEVK